MIWQKPGILNIECGFEHTLIWCRNDEIYVFGKNTFGQAGMPKEVKICTKITKIENLPKNVKIKGIKAGIK